RFDAGLAAYAATRRDGEIALEPLAQTRGGHMQDNIHGIGFRLSLAAGDRADLAQFLARVDEALSQQKARGEFAIVTRRAHRQGETAAAKANLQRLLDREGFNHWATVPGFPTPF